MKIPPETVERDLRSSGLHAGGIAIAFYGGIPLLPFILLRWMEAPNVIVSIALIAGTLGSAAGVLYWLLQRLRAAERSTQAANSEQTHCPVCSGALDVPDRTDGNSNFQGWVCPECGAHIDGNGDLIV